MWEIYAYHNSESLSGIFNAIAGIMGSSTYRSAIAAVGFCGFIVAMVSYMFAPERMQGWKWIGTVVLVYGALFVPRVTVGIVDKTGGTPVRVIANVPFGMAVLGGLSSSIGNSMTELFETAFQTIPGAGALPAELSYQQNGLMFGSRLIKETRGTSIPDPSVRNDLINFANNCTAYDIADGTISATAFSKSASVWADMAATNPARFTTVTTAAGITTTTCDAAYASIDSRLPAQITDLIARLGLRMHPDLSATAAQAAILNQVPQAYIRSQIADASATAADLIRQNALMNAINDAGELACQANNDPACMMMATGRAQAVAAQNAAWINGAKIADQALPVVRNVAEAMCYALFPLVVLLLFLSSGRTTVVMISGYAAAMISIQLWPPLFAILNYMASIYAQFDQAAAAQVGVGVKALSLQSASPIYSNSISAQAVVSYLIIGIPMLAYSLANRLVNFGSAVVGGLQGLQNASMSGNASAAAAVGNAGIGNVTMDQHVVSPATSNPWVSRSQDSEGNWNTTTASGAVATSYLRNEGAVSNIVSTRVSHSSVQESAKQVEAAKLDAVAASRDVSSALAETVNHSASRFQSNGRSAGQSVSSSSELGMASDRLRSYSDSVAKSTGLGSQQVAQIAFGLSGGIGIAKVGVDASGRKTYSGDLTESERKVANAMSAEQFREFQSFAERATHDQSAVRSMGRDSRDGEELSSRLSAAVSRSESAQTTLSQRETVAKRLSLAYESGDGMTIDLAQLPRNSEFLRKYQTLAEQYGPDSLALQVAMASELASRALPPTHNFAGTALPASFSDVQGLYGAHRADPTFSADRVMRAGAANDWTVRSHAPGGGELGALHVPDRLSTVQEHLSDQVGAHGVTPSHDFDQRHEIVRDPDGTVTTRKSLAVGAARQVGADAEATAENARESYERAKEAGLRAAEERRHREAESTRSKRDRSDPRSSEGTPQRWSQAVTQGVDSHRLPSVPGSGWFCRSKIPSPGKRRMASISTHGSFTSPPNLADGPPSGAGFERGLPVAIAARKAAIPP